MAVVNWDKDIEINVISDGVSKAKYRREYTIAAAAELSDIVTTDLLQGSICYDISTGKMHIWDGSAWVEQ